MSDPLRSRLIRIASELPQGDPTRRRILASMKSGGSYDEFVAPPSLNWDHVRKQFSEATDKWYDGLSEYRDVMELIEAGAKRAGPEYQKVAQLAKRGQTTAKHLLNQHNAVQDDLYSMQNSMPQIDDDDY